MSTETDKQPEPCPHCGSKNITVENFEGHHSCGCDNEDCYGYQSLAVFPRKIDAINGWNTRSPSAQAIRDEALEQAAVVADQYYEACKPGKTGPFKGVPVHPLFDAGERIRKLKSTPDLKSDK